MIFRRIRAHFAVIGISKANLSENKRGLNLKVLCGLCMFGFYVISSMAYLYLYAHGFRGYTESIYMTSIAIFALFCILMLILKSNQLFDMLDSIEKMIAETHSKYWQIVLGSLINHPKSKYF